MLPLRIVAARWLANSSPSPPLMSRAADSLAGVKEVTARKPISPRRVQSLDPNADSLLSSFSLPLVEE